MPAVSRRRWQPARLCQWSGSGKTGHSWHLSRTLLPLVAAAELGRPHAVGAAAVRESPTGFARK